MSELQKYSEQHINPNAVTHVKDNGVNGVTLFFVGGGNTTLNRADADKFLEANGRSVEKPANEQQ